MNAATEHHGKLLKSTASLLQGTRQRLLSTALFSQMMQLKTIERTRSRFLIPSFIWLLTACRLCLILTMMTIVIFVINIIQARLLDYIIHPAWIIGLPAILFALFLLLIVNHVRENPDAFLPHRLDFRKRVRHAAMHIHALKKDQEYCEPEPKKCMHHFVELKR